MSGDADPTPVVDDETFMENVREALINGHDIVCAECGVGVSSDGMDIHERPCSLFIAASLR